MTDEALHNESWAEAARENFDEAVKQQDWSHARTVLADLESNHFSTVELRRGMNLAMAEEEKGDYFVAKLSSSEFESPADTTNINFHD